MFFAQLQPDMNLVGFPLTPPQLAAAHWWFVLEQQLTAPRFGFDVGGQPDSPPQSWSDVPWSMLKVEPGAHIRLTVEPFATKKFGSRPFGSTADEIAVSLLQRPIRVALHKNRLLSAPAGDV
jgi:hypothetical protein